MPSTCRPLDRTAALDFLYGRIDYERSATLAPGMRELQLERMRDLLCRLGSPELRFPAIHIAGTKGKGSTAAMTAAILAAAGFRTGLFTSPHLDRIEERIAIDGRAIDEAELLEQLAELHGPTAAMDAVAQRNGGIGPTFFELLTAAAFCIFARRGVDVAVLEVGLGGRLDSTNVCRPIATAITSISLDHTRQLGGTLDEIAGEKAGVVKPGVPMFCGVREAGPAAVIHAACRRAGSRCWQLGEDFDFEYYPPRSANGSEAPRASFIVRGREPARRIDDAALSLVGRHQAANAAIAVALTDELIAQGWRVSESAVRRGLAEVRWPARLEVVGRRPLVIVDAAHNGASIRALVAALDESCPARRRALVFATTRDKDVPGMLSEALARFDRVLLTQYESNPRALPVDELAAAAASHTADRWTAYPNLAAAWSAAREWAAADDLICGAGSVFLAAELRRLAHGETAAMAPT